MSALKPRLTFDKDRYIITLAGKVLGYLCYWEDRRHWTAHTIDLNLGTFEARRNAQDAVVAHHALAEQAPGR